jgi:hypothetical protein
MEKVAEFINAESYRQALARLCRLAGSSTSDGRRVLDDWENRHEEDEMMLMDAIDRIERIDNRESMITSEEVEADPLLWFRALDDFCVRINPKSYGYLRNPCIHDGEGQVWMIPIYQKSESSGGGKRRQFGNIAYWLKHFRVIPQNNPQGILVNVVGIPRGYNDWLAGRFSARTIRIAVVHFDDGVRTHISDSDKKPSDFICKEISDTEIRLASALHHISEAQKRNAHILVMPELTITPDIRTRIASELQQSYRKNGEKHSLSVPLIVLGSFHEKVEKGWRNHAEAMLGLDGKLLFGCDKRKPVTYENRKEGIECAPDDFTCLFTSLGLMALAICKDVFEGEPAIVLASLPLDWLLVPSMTNKLNPHKATAKAMYDTLGTIVVVANQEPPAASTPVRGFVQHQKFIECTEALDIVSVTREEFDVFTLFNFST